MSSLSGIYAQAMGPQAEAEGGNATSATPQGTVPPPPPISSTCDQTSKVLGGVVTTHDNDTVTVHEYRQAPNIQSRFTPLYTNTSNQRLEAKLKPQSCHIPVMHTVNRMKLVTSGSISNYHVDSRLFDTLRSLGVVDQ